jgi:hypothetical protein
MGFQLERIVFTHPHVKHAVTGEGLPGFTLKVGCELSYIQ